MQNENSKLKNDEKMQKIVAWAKRRAFIYQSAEIYGGTGGIYDFGPYGVELKRNLRESFWARFIKSRDDIVGLDSGIIMKAAVWEASGHTGPGFADPLSECKRCHKRFRSDHLASKQKTVNPPAGEADSKQNRYKCPDCGGELTAPRMFNILVKTYLGPAEDTSSIAYLRGETAQGMFVDFKNILETTRVKIPFGLAQIGKAFRNEITPGNFIFRTREFEQGEIEWFCDPENKEKSPDYWFETWVNEWMKFFLDLGIDKKNLKFRPHQKEELAHYSKATTDVEYNFPWGWSELAGIANRTDFDLKNHEKNSGKDMKYFDEASKRKYIPWVIEPTMGIDRTILALFCDGYLEEKINSETRVVFKIDPKLAPVKVAILPLVKDEKIMSIAKKLFDKIKKAGITVEYDESGTIGRRYRRQDEIGTPWCVTIDFDSLKDKKATIRDRDTLKQKRVKIAEIKDRIELGLKWL
jgi:glycyl-tRNA synthetase